MATVVTTENMNQYITDSTLNVPQGAIVTHSAIERASKENIKLNYNTNEEEPLIRLITQITADRMAERGIDPQSRDLKIIVKKVLSAVQEKGYTSCSKTEPQGQIVLTAFGRDSIGVISSISSILSDYKASILDMNQRILKEFFTLIMILDFSKSDSSFEDLNNALQKLAQQKNIKIITQLEQIFRYMHRV
jgi:ACT domain-containing protein